MLHPRWVLRLCPRWTHCYAPDGLNYLNVTPQMGSMLYPWLVFSMSRPGCVWPTRHSLEGPVKVSSAAFISQRRICCVSVIFVISDHLIICSYFIIFRYLLVLFFGTQKTDDSQVNQLKQKFKLTVLASRASGTSENYFKRPSIGGESLPAVHWTFPIFLSVLWIVPSTCCIS